MTFKEWLNIVLDKGLICERYLPAVDAARSRKQFMDVVLDVNGMAFLCDMREKGYGLPYDVMYNEFNAYLNGRYIHTKSTLARGYTASMYCRVETPSEITINTTLTGIFGCSCSIHVPANTYCQLIVDGSSVVNITVGNGGKCYVDLWRGGEATFDDADSVVVKHKSIGDE
jgi:hypothetical protein